MQLTSMQLQIEAVPTGRGSSQVVICNTAIVRASMLDSFYIALNDYFRALHAAFRAGPSLLLTLSAMSCLEHAPIQCTMCLILYKTCR